MATTIITNLYPPIMPDVIPAFIRTANCRIYFALSSYNKLEDIKENAVQVTIIDQRTNISALKISSYPSGIKLATIQTDTTVQDNYKYYIEITPNDLITGSFELNTFYKVQIRFTSTEASNPPSQGGLDKWLSNNIDYFSEWSTVCLIKGIE